MIKMKWFARNIDILLMAFLFSILFVLPVIFVRNNNGIEWHDIRKIWQDYVLLLPLFAINHWLLVPKLILKKAYISYLAIIVMLITAVSASYYMYDNATKNRPAPPPREGQLINPPPPVKKADPIQQNPAVPPYANLLFLSLMTVAVDTGLSFSKQWYRSEEDKIRLENKNSQAQLRILQNQINPHFFMNTLNNIYSLIGSKNEKPRTAVMQLSKLMRYLLYENASGKVLLSKEFGFIENYVHLMELRYEDHVDIKLNIPENYEDVEIPSLLFISFFENAFKYGVSYQQKSFVHANFELNDDFLVFTCKNSRNVFDEDSKKYSGIGLQNSKQRLDLLYQDRYDLTIDQSDETFSVELKIPIR